MPASAATSPASVRIVRSFQHPVFTEDIRQPRFPSLDAPGPAATVESTPPLLSPQIAHLFPTLLADRPPFVSWMNARCRSTFGSAFTTRTKKIS